MFSDVAEFPNDCCKSSVAENVPFPESESGFILGFSPVKSDRETRGFSTRGTRG